jgi:shikimate kinase
MALRQSSMIFYLQASPTKIYNNISIDASRPLLNTNNKLTMIKDLLNRRHPLYQQAADHIIFTNPLTSDEVVKKILTIFFTPYIKLYELITVKDKEIIQKPKKTLKI